jgi:hypothetical protein
MTAALAGQWFAAPSSRSIRVVVLPGFGAVAAAASGDYYLATENQAAEMAAFINEELRP